MRTRSSRLPWIAAVVAIAATAVWQYADLGAHQAEHRAEHRRHGLALLDAADSVAVRECRGGRYSPPELQVALEDARRTFDLAWLAIRAADGESVAEAGQRPNPLDPQFAFEKRFEPLRPIGRGPRWNSGTPLVDLPGSGLLLVVATASAGLEARLADDRSRALVTAVALSLAILTFAGLFWLHTRSVELRADLAASRTRLDGLETLRRLGAGLVHETKNPLGVVRGFAERIANGRIPGEELPRTAQAILEETDRTVARLDEFLLLSRPAELRRTRVAVGDLLAELEMLLRPDLDSAGATLVVHCGGTELDADRDQLRRLLMNLMLNAVRALDRGGRIELGCDAGPDGTRIVVADDGRGVPEELRETLFEPYVTGTPGGTGLGLSIARRIANDHGFELRYEPRTPRGTRMILEIPSR